MKKRTFILAQTFTANGGKREKGRGGTKVKKEEIRKKRRNLELHETRGFERRGMDLPLQ